MSIRSIIELFKGRNIDSAAMLLAHKCLDSIATIDDDALQKKLLKELIRGYVRLEKRVNMLLQNTLPSTVANELKYEDAYKPRSFYCTILFTDFVGFTRLAEIVSPQVLVETLHTLFSEFDSINQRFQGTKIKTIGDAYMAVFGAPEPYADHAAMAIDTAMNMLEIIKRFNFKFEAQLRMRIGIHTGNVMTGVIGKERMQFDIFGDNVNIAARFESSGVPDRINVSEVTYLATQQHFNFEARGDIDLKNKARMKAYLVSGKKGV